MPGVPRVRDGQHPTELHQSVTDQSRGVVLGNLPGFECAAASEREALATIIPPFKKRVGELMQSGNPIPWIEPPNPVKPGERQRFIPVHL